MRLLRRGRRRGEAELLAAVRWRLAERGWPAEGLSDGDLKAGVRRVWRALDEGRLPAEGLLLSSGREHGRDRPGPQRARRGSAARSLPTGAPQRAPGANREAICDTAAAIGRGTPARVTANVQELRRHAAGGSHHGEGE